MLPPIKGFNKIVLKSQDIITKGSFVLMQPLDTI